MPPEADQQALSLLARRAAALAAIEAEQDLIARPIEFGRIFYFALRTPGTAWPTDQNGKLRKDLKSERYSLSRIELLSWLAASLGLLCIDCGSHCYPNCITRGKYSSRRNRRGKVYLPASAIADPQNPSRFTLSEAESPVRVGDVPADF